jgi:hypothetical protein
MLDYDWPPPEPPPLTTIAWMVTDLGLVAVLDDQP